MELVDTRSLLFSCLSLSVVQTSCEHAIIACICKSKSCILSIDTSSWRGRRPPTPATSRKAKRPKVSELQPLQLQPQSSEHVPSVPEQDAARCATELTSQLEPQLEPKQCKEDEPARVKKHVGVFANLETQQATIPLIFIDDWPGGCWKCLSFQP